MEVEPTPDYFPMIPAELKELPQWVNWTYREDTKVPLNPATMGNAMVNKPNTWATYDDVIYEGSQRNLGIGFVLTESDPYTATDLDKCWKRGMPLDDRTRDILDLLKGYTELSPSLTGLHIFVQNELSVNRRTSGIEVYSSGRWMSMTGRANPQAPQIVPVRTDEVQELIRRFFTKEAPISNYKAPQEVSTDDTEVWVRMSRWQNGQIIENLRRGIKSDMRSDDDSYADTYLANALALIVGNDAPRIKRMMYQTGLVREKYSSPRGNGRDWLDLIIENSIRWADNRRR